MPSYVNVTDFDHTELPGVGILLANLGTPDAPTAPALRRYLREFLSDPRVIELPRWKWWPILNLFVLTFRPRKSAALYRQVWTDEGSPLLVIGNRQREKLEALLAERIASPFAVELGMRYGNPSMASALDKLRARGCTRILLLPLYPQYAAATTASTVDALAMQLLELRRVPEVRTVNTYHDHPGYIDALAASIREVWDEGGEPDKLLFSYHGIPQRYFDGGDPYHCLCHKTSRLTAERLGLAKDRYVTSFQSLFGREEWIKPYTDKTVEALAHSGVKKLDIICPGFSADCLETIEEIDGENREIFEEAGGEQFRYIPALNDRDDHLEALADLTMTHLQGWVSAPGAWDEEAAKAEVARSKQRADAMAASPPKADGGFG